MSDDSVPGDGNVPEGGEDSSLEGIAIFQSEHFSSLRVLNCLGTQVNGNRILDFEKERLGS